MATVNTMELDFTGVTSFNYIPEGVHTVKIKEATFTKASTGTNQLEIIFETADGATRKAWYNLQPQALWKVKNLLETLNIPCEGKIRLSNRDLIGKTCEITVEPDENDETRLLITRVAKIEATPVEVPYAAQPAQVVTPVQEIPVQEAAPVPPQGNLPPWMKNTTPANNAVPPQGNLPPWMKK